MTKTEAEASREAEERQPNLLLRLILKHYGVVKYERSEKQIQRERYLLPGVPFNRWVLFPAAVLLQFCCGSLYAWSVYNVPIDTLIYGENRQVAPITFYIAVGFFGLSTSLMGPWLERRGPMVSGLLGSTLFLIGNLLTALALYTKQMWLVFIGYGIIGGFGLGLCYITPVSSLQKWFPDKRGLGSGFAVCGFGAGSIAIALVPLPLSKVVGLPLVFVILGCCFFFIMTLASLVLRSPPPGYTVNGMTSDREVVEESASFSEESQSRDKEDLEASQHPSKPASIKLNLIESLSSLEFGVMYVMFFANSIFGLVVISRLSNMIQLIFGQTPEVASTIVSINGGFNLFGRLFFSIISDFIGRKPCYMIMLSFQLIILGCFATITTSRSYWPFVIIMWILTGCYGGGFGVIPAFLSDMFGSSNIGACHGIILTAWSIAGVGGGLIFTAIYDSLLDSGYTKTDPEPYNINVWWIFAIVAIGWVTFLFLRVSTRDRLLPNKPGEIFRLRVLNRIFRVSYNAGFKTEYLTKQQEDSEWETYLQTRNQ